MKSEAKIQQEIFTYHWNNYPEERGLLFMVHNEASSRIRGARLKSLGMVRGVSDMIYLRPHPNQVSTGDVIFLEIKSEKGKQTKHQKAWQELLFNNGWIQYFVVRSLEQAKNICGWTK